MPASPDHDRRAAPRVSQDEALEHFEATGTPYDSLTVPALATLTVRGGGLWIHGDLSQTALILSRFADQPIAPIPPLEGRSALLVTPARSRRRALAGGDRCHEVARRLRASLRLSGGAHRPSAVWAAVGDLKQRERRDAWKLQGLLIHLEALRKLSEQAAGR